MLGPFTFTYFLVDSSVVLHGVEVQVSGQAGHLLIAQLLAKELRHPPPGQQRKCNSEKTTKIYLRFKSFMLKDSAAYFCNPPPFP
jgi:hypothetical protein